MGFKRRMKVMPRPVKRMRMRAGMGRGVASGVTGLLGAMLQQTFDKAAAQKQSSSARSGVLTVQNDVRSAYRKRRVPRARVRRARRFYRSVQNSISSLYPVCTHHLSYGRILSTTIPLPSTFYFYPIYSLNADVNNSLSADDQEINQQLENIFRAYSPLPPGGGTQPSPLSTESRILFTDCQSTLLLSAYSDNPAAAIVTVYTLVARKDSAVTANRLFNNGIVSKNLGSIPNQTGLGALTPNQASATPFDSSLLCRSFLITNIKKVQISPGDSIELQMRDRRQHEISTLDFNFMFGTNDVSLASKRGLTRGYLVRVLGAPASQVSVTAVNVSTVLRNVYRFRILSDQLAHGAFQLTSQP